MHKKAYGLQRVKTSLEFSIRILVLRLKNYIKEQKMNENGHNNLVVMHVEFFFVFKIY